MTDISYSSPRNNSVGNFLHGTLIWSVTVVTTSFVGDYSLPLLMSVVCVPDMRIFMFGYNLAPPVTQYLSTDGELLNYNKLQCQEVAGDVKGWKCLRVKIHS